jgi:hypothetical protein
MPGKLLCLRLQGQKRPPMQIAWEAAAVLSGKERQSANAVALGKRRYKRFVFLCKGNVGAAAGRAAGLLSRIGDMVMPEAGVKGRGAEWGWLPDS